MKFDTTKAETQEQPIILYRNGAEMKGSARIIANGTLRFDIDVTPDAPFILKLI